MLRRRNQFWVVLAMAALMWAPTRACTIFVLTDETSTLFFNNEDWFNRETRLWFVPAGQGHLGCAYVGFDNGWAQGGLNTTGLAFDWVSGFDENYEPDPGLRRVRGNPSERMLESCATVEEAIAFYQRHLEPDFKRSRILIADRSGASVIIGSHQGKFHFVLRRDNRGYGYGRAVLDRELAKSPSPTLDNGAAILRACLQPGEGGTKYSNVFDLRSGEIVLFPFPGRDEHVRFNLAAELAKGGHYYDIPRVTDQIRRPPRPLLNPMQRFFLDQFRPLADQEPVRTDRVHALLCNVSAGKSEPADYAADFWRKIAPQQKENQAEIQKLGELMSLVLVDRKQETAGHAYYYLIDFKKARVLVRYVFDDQDKVALIQREGVELK